jgi:psiF repeat
MRIDGLVFVAALSLAAAHDALAFDAATPAASTSGPTVRPRVAPNSEDAAGRSAKSIECSHKADAQNLHGKPRKQFMLECKHGA